MNVLIFNKDGRYNFLAKKFADDNNKVLSYPKTDSTGTDLSKLFENIEEDFGFRYTDKLPSADSVDLVFGTDLSFVKYIDSYKAQGVPVFGGNAKMAKFELDRMLGKQLMQAAGINIPPYFSGKIKDAIEWVKQKKIKGVVKPHQNLETFKTYVPYEMLDTLIALERLQKTNPSAEVTVEQYIDGVEVGVETYFNGEDFLRPINISFEHKKLAEGDRGALCGETGTVMFYDFVNEKLFDMTLARIRNVLVHTGYTGDLAIGCMYDPHDDKLYGLEWTFRIGMPEFLIQLSSLPDFTDTIYRITTDPLYTALDVDDVFCTGVWYLISGFPFLRRPISDALYGFPLHGYKKNMPDVYLADVAYSKKYGYYTVGGEILVAVGTGETMQESVQNAYDLLSKIRIVNGFYRTDIGERVLNRDIHILYQAGLISQEKYLRSSVII